MNWKEHEFDIPLGIDLPDKVLSTGEDWWDDCDEDDVFGLKPCYYSSKNLYDAALKLCHVCGGWFYFETEEEQNKEIELLRKMLTATEKSPLNYYDVQYGRFDWVAALYEVCGLSTPQIALSEGVNQNAVWESITAAKARIKKFLRNF